MTQVLRPLEEIRSRRDNATPGLVASQHACPEDRCGVPQSGPGHPRRGWLKVHIPGDAPDPWFCSWHCLSRYAIRRELHEGLAS